MTTAALQSLVDRIQVRLSVICSRQSDRHFDPRLHKRVLGESIGRIVKEIAGTIPRPLPVERLLPPLDAFWEISEAGAPNVAEDGANGVSFTIGNIRQLEELYERTIANDFPLVGKEAIATETSTAQKMQGSFYTPYALAFDCVSTSVDQYIERRLSIRDFSRVKTHSSKDIKKVAALLSNTTVCDPSCGVARFLVAIVHYIHRFVAEHISTAERNRLALCLSRNLHGYDVDPIAIGIARLRLLAELEGIGAPIDHGAVFSNIVHANPLIVRDSTYCANVAVGNYFEGFLYDPSLGRPSGFLDLKWDLVVGNPPWEKIRLEERSFFQHFMADIVLGTSKRERKHEIDGIKIRYPGIYRYFEEISEHIDDARKQIQSDPVFRDSSCGELNTCALFVELGLRALKPDVGLGGLLVKTSILTHYAHRKLFASLQGEKLIAEVYDFTNRARYFPIDSRERFSWLVFGGHNETIRLAMNLDSSGDMRNAAKMLRVSQATLRLLNPDTGMLPSARSPESFALLVGIYEHSSVFAQEYSQAKFGRLVHLTTHSNEIHRTNGVDHLPVLEGKFIERYDGRFAGFDGIPKKMRFEPKATARRSDASLKEDARYRPEPRYYVSKGTWKRLTAQYQEPWSIFWRSTTSASNTRTCIATILPHGPAIQSLQMLQLKGETTRDLAVLLATMNSKIFDFLVRNKLSGIDLTQNVIKQIAIPSRSAWLRQVILNEKSATLESHVLCRVAQLLSADVRLVPFVRSLKVEFSVEGATRELLDYEIDLLVAKAYGLNALEIEKVLGHFGSSN